MTAQRKGFGELLRRLRVTAGLTQEALAEKAGLSVRGLSDLERRVRQAPHPDTVRRLAEALVLEQENRAALVQAALADSYALSHAHGNDRAVDPSVPT